jgi:hypothetical protein
MLAQPMAQDPLRGEHHWAYPHNEDQMDEINVIFRGSLSIASKTQEKKLEREISLAQHIEPDRRMKWFEVDISFRAEDHSMTTIQSELVLRGQAPDRAAQGGQDSNQQFMTSRVSCCHVYPLQGCKLVRISVTLSEMSDGLITVFKHSNLTLLCYFNCEDDVDYFVVMA